jgi:hypothetical protein
MSHHRRDFIKCSLGLGLAGLASPLRGAALGVSGQEAAATLELSD